MEMNNEFGRRPLFQVTVDELLKAIKEELAPRKENSNTDTKVSKKHYVYGIKGLAMLFGCSTATAQRKKSSGVIDPAISQNGKIIIVDADLALDLLRVSNEKKWRCR